jgi:glutathionylspermidine synthase
MLARELVEVEQAALERPEVLRELGLPRRLVGLLRRGPLTPGAARVMRFDFHATGEGWRISEVNSDVPGGYTEASSFTRLMGQACGYEPAGDPAAALVEALVEGGAGGGPVLLMAAAGYMEDQQIVAYLARALGARGLAAGLVTPNQLGWREGRAYATSDGASGAAGAIVRFYQAEWMSDLRPRGAWGNLFSGGHTPVVNPPMAIVGESKRLPLLWSRLGCAVPTWRRLLPETRDPRDVPWRRDEAWLLKTAYCNTGDTVCLREGMPKWRWRRVCAEVWLSPRQWIAQRRFATSAIDTPRGPMRPCIGVYTVNGRAAGIYTRLARGLVTDYTAMDAAVLLEEDER